MKEQDPIVFTEKCDFFAEVTQTVVMKEKPDHVVFYPIEKIFIFTKVNVWGIISRKGPSIIRRYEGTMFGKGYSSLLNKVIYPLKANFNDKDLLLQQNNQMKKMDFHFDPYY